MLTRLVLGAATLLASLPVFGRLALAAQETAPPPPVEAALEPVESLYVSLLEVMKRADELGFEGRYSAIEPEVRSQYDLPFMAAKILGHQWKKLSDEQKAVWLDTFTRLTVSTYAARFDGYEGERLEVIGAEDGARGTALVKTVIVPPKEEPVELDYRLIPVNGRWRIVDVYLEGTISELALRRADYSGVIKRDGFDALLAAVGEKIAQAEAGELDD